MLSRAQIKTTNLSMAVVLTFLLTNLPYIVDEFIRQKIVINQDCDQEWCKVGKVRYSVSLVYHSQYPRQC